MSEEQRNYGMEPEPEGSGGGSGPGRTMMTSTSPQDENTWSILAHLSVFLNILTGFLGPVAALVIWLMYKDRSPRVAFHALQSSRAGVAHMFLTYTRSKTTRAIIRLMKPSRSTAAVMIGMP